MTDDLLTPLRGAAAGFRRLADLEVAGRTLMAVMRGHFAQLRELLGVREYLSRFYDGMAQEFAQFDDYDFVVHHCVRQQFWHVKEELDLLRAGPLGAALDRAGAPLPRLRSPTSPGRRAPIAQSWYGDVYGALRDGRLPEPRGPRNPVLGAGECVMRAESQRDLVGPQFLIWCGETWGRQVVAAWQVLRNLIALRRAVDEDAAGGQAAVGAATAGFAAAAGALAATYHEWHAMHAGTVDVHDPMYDANRDGLFAWVDGFAPGNADWTIKDATKDEMYLELAATVLALRGQAPTVGLPAPAYWRCTPFAPASIRIGAAGMPPYLTPGSSARPGSTPE